MGVLLSVGVIYGLLNHVQWVGFFLSIAIVVTIGLIFFLVREENSLHRKRTLLALLLTAFYIVFMILLQQSGGALNLFTDTNVDRMLGSWKIETGMFQSVEPLALVLLSPLYNRLWIFMGQKNIHLSDVSISRYRINRLTLFINPCAIFTPFKYIIFRVSYRL